MFFMFLFLCIMYCKKSNTHICLKYDLQQQSTSFNDYKNINKEKEIKYRNGKIQCSRVKIYLQDVGYEQKFRILKILLFKSSTSD